MTLLVHPMVRHKADTWSTVPTAQAQPVAASESSAIVLPAPLPGMRPVSTALSPIRFATAPRPAGQSPTGPAVSQQQGTEMGEQAPIRPRRMRDGCEGALSSLVGPEARRMVPGRCIA
ncbi:hypothetical protein [Methylobacterium segetis]|uniref:hypothetical protein n=1 Tax=Methylobacterium segetis TaxID=2488750 RepID=UPI001FE1F36B|nr:hypothetical protein [Methylobacterium segetis]